MLGAIHVMEEKMNLPCIQTKCILLPICKGKFEIECTILAAYYGKETGESYISGDKVWVYIETIFPKLLEINGPMIQTKSLRYRSFKIYKYPDPGYPEFKQTPEEI